jgi:hypothetical protein
MYTPKAKHPRIERPSSKYTKKLAVNLMITMKINANTEDKGTEIRRIGHTLPKDMNLPYQVD